MTISPHSIAADDHRIIHASKYLHDETNRSYDDDQSSEPKLPASLEQYMIIRTLGKGSCSRVQLAKHRTNQELVAIKIIQKENFIKLGHQERLRREIRILSLLQQPFIVSLKGVVETKDAVYIVMEYASGGELFDYINNHSFITEQEIRRLFRQILSAIYYCHLNNIIHRDLKLENLLLDANNNIKIINFGFGNVFGHSIHLNTFCGSPYYAAPGMIFSHPYHGPEVDVWSLGVVLYVLFAKRLPFENLNTINLYQKITTGNFILPLSIPEECRCLIINMLSPNPNSRYTMHQVLTHPWVNIGHKYPPDPRIPYRESINPDNMNLNVTHYLLRSGYTMTQIESILFSHASHPLKSEYYLLIEGMKDGRVSISIPSNEANQSNTASRRNSNDFTLQIPSQTSMRKKSLPEIYSFSDDASILNHLTILKDDNFTAIESSSLKDNALKRLITKIFRKLSINSCDSVANNSDATCNQMLSSSPRELTLNHLQDCKPQDNHPSNIEYSLKTFSKWNIKRSRHLMLDDRKICDPLDHIVTIMNCVQISLHRLGILFDIQHGLCMHHCTYYSGAEESPLQFDLEIGVVSSKKSSSGTSFVVVLNKTSGSFWLWRKIVSNLFSMLKTKSHHQC